MVPAKVGFEYLVYSMTKIISYEFIGQDCSRPRVSTCTELYETMSLARKLFMARGKDLGLRQNMEFYPHKEQHVPTHGTPNGPFPYA
jgi:hypothetical protein